MVDAVIKVMAEANQCKYENGLNPFRAQSCAILPLDVQRNFSGFLVRKKVIPFTTNSPKLLMCITLLKDQFVIKDVQMDMMRPLAIMLCHIWV